MATSPCQARRAKTEAIEGRRRVNPVKGVKEEKLLAEKTIEDILLYFGNRTEEARKKYRQFVKDGIERGRRPELQGGGLIRSSGGGRIGLLGRNKEERDPPDSPVRLDLARYPSIVGISVTA